MSIVHLAGPAPADPAELEGLRLLPVATVADLLGVARQTVYGLIYAGELPGTHVGRAVRVSATSLRAYIDKQTSR